MLQIQGLWSCRVHSPDKVKCLPNTEADIRSWANLYRWPRQFWSVKPCCWFGGFFVCLFLDLYLKIPCLPLGSLQQLCEMLGQNPKSLKWCSDTSQNVSGFDWWHVHPSCDHEWSGWGTYRLWWNASFDIQFTPKLTTILLSFSLQKLLSSKWKRMPVT